MNSLVNLLRLYNFERTTLPLSSPLIIHSVPGSGKTSLLRALINLEDKVSVYTFGVPDKPNLSGKFIKKVPESIEGDFIVIDEYISGRKIEEASALFSDPFQNSAEFKRAHYIKSLSFRVPKEISRRLNRLGYEITSEKVGEYSVEEFFGPDPEGKVIAFQSEVVDYLKDFGIVASIPCELRGAEFEVVTLFVSEKLEDLLSPELYVAFTRASKKLILRTTEYQAEIEDLNGQTSDANNHSG